MGDMLRHNSTLLDLDLSNCRLGADACMVLAEGVKGNTRLRTLRLDYNVCGEDGGRHLMSALMVGRIYAIHVF